MVDLITYVDRMPGRGETIEAPRFDLGFGGKGANQAVAAALLGAEVRMVTKVGSDMFGPNTRANLEHHGIDTTFVETADGVSSGVAPIFVEPDSSNSILIVKGANSHLSPADVDRAAGLIIDSDIVVLQLEIQLESVYHTIDLCSRNGIPVLLNPAPADPNLDIAKIRGVTFFVPNESELRGLTGMPTGTREEATAAATSVVKQGIATVIVTLGEQGALLVTEAGTRFVPAHRVESVDSTGAGDAFIGCFAASLPGAVEQAMERASVYAALSTTKPGTQKSFADREVFDRYLVGL